MGGVEKLFEDISEVSNILRKNSEISLDIAIGDISRKALLLAAASYFEFRLTTDIKLYCERKFGADNIFVNLIQAKAINRQYHTWFSWDSKNANSFFSLFGNDFKIWMENKVKNDINLDNNIKAFIQLGSDRNRLVHQDFATFVLESDIHEISNRYEKARQFVENFVIYLDEYSSSKLAT